MSILQITLLTTSCVITSVSLLFIIIYRLHKWYINRLQITIEPCTTYSKTNYFCGSYSNKNIIWSMEYYTDDHSIRIGCKIKSRSGWEHFFGDKCITEYQNRRDSSAFRIIKKDYYRFIKQVDKLKKRNNTK